MAVWKNPSDVAVDEFWPKHQETEMFLNLILLWISSYGAHCCCPKVIKNKQTKTFPLLGGS